MYSSPHAAWCLALCLWVGNGRLGTNMPLTLLCSYGLGVNKPSRHWHQKGLLSNTAPCLSFKRLYWNWCGKRDLTELCRLPGAWIRRLLIMLFSPWLRLWRLLGGRLLFWLIHSSLPHSGSMEGTLGWVQLAPDDWNTDHFSKTNYYVWHYVIIGCVHCGTVWSLGLLYYTVNPFAHRDSASQNTSNVRLLRVKKRGLLHGAWQLSIYFILFIYTYTPPLAWVTRLRPAHNINNL